LVFDFWNSTTPGLPSFPLSLANLMAASTASRCTEKTRSKVLRLDYPLALALKHNELDERDHLVEPAESPDEKDDRDRYADQPKQKTSTHNFLLLVASQPNVGSKLRFHAFDPAG
jgi:hypothetical protein